MDRRPQRQNPKANQSKDDNHEHGKQRVLLCGSLGKDPEVRTFDGGKKLPRFGMVTTGEYRAANGVQVKDIQWHNLEAWGKMADLTERLSGKGMKVAIEGRLSTSSYTDK